ncbi:hypothetical protein P5673_010814 [Acropora cervicornis]|uniref:Uncharacterized protein n=1 Tax=Acropora cervicornis TaxID=6130 RepID=A0AAD9QQT7_ACRCE|nr:hypothetical protein P5673_010814 [Acropora cervicornis]
MSCPTQGAKILKPALKPACHVLCSSETVTASTKYLFEDDLAKQIWDVKEGNRIQLEMQSVTRIDSMGLVAHPEKSGVNP